MPKRPDSVKRARAWYKERQRQMRDIISKYSFICPICKKMFKRLPTENLDILSKMTEEESKYYLTLAHIRHHHTNYDQDLRSIMAWKKEMLKELEKKQAEVIEEFRLCKDRINEKFSSARLKLIEYYKEESKKMLEACPKVVFKPLTRAEKKKLGAKRKKARKNAPKPVFGFESWVAKKKPRRRRKKTRK